jgi:hypothetical protein
MNMKTGIAALMIVAIIAIGTAVGSTMYTATPTPGGYIGVSNGDYSLISQYSVIINTVTPGTSLAVVYFSSDLTTVVKREGILADSNGDLTVFEVP